MKKRFLSGLLAAVMTLGLALSAFPAIIANAATAEPISSINLADKFEEGVAKYLDGETEEVWTGWKDVASLTFGSFKFLLNVQNYKNITRAWADGTTAGVEGKMTWGKDADGNAIQGYVEGGSGMAAISSTGNAIRFEAAYTQTQKATYTVERDGVYNLVADVANVDYSDTNPHQETVKLEVLVNGELADEITLAYGETGTIATEIKTLYVGDTITLQTTSIRDNDEIHWKYKLDVAAELQVFEDLGPDATYNLADLMREAYTSDSYVVNQTIANNTFGPYYFKLNYGTDYDKTWITFGGSEWSTLASDGTIKYINGWKGTYGSPRIAVNTDASAWDGFGFSAQNTAYTNWVITAVFVAPKDGVYNFVPKSAKSDASAWTNSPAGATYSITVNGVAQLMDGTNAEVTIAKNSTTNLPEISDINLKAGDTIEVSIKKPQAASTDWGYGYVGANFDINLVEDLTPIESWNLYDEFSTNLAVLAADGTDYVGTAIENLNLGAFKLSPFYYSSVKNLSATAIGGKTTSGSNCHDVLKLANNLVNIHTCYTNPVTIKFTAPKTGAYIIDLSDVLTYNMAFNSSSFKVLVGDEALAIGPNGETVIDKNNLLTNETAATINLTDVEIELTKDDIVSIVVATGCQSASPWTKGTATFDCTINLVEDLTPKAPEATYNIADEIRNVASALDFGEATYLRINKAMGEYAFGAFNLVSIKAMTAAVSTTLQEIENTGGKYTIYPNQKNSGTAGWQTNWYNNPNVSVEAEVSKFDGIAFNSKIWSENYAPAVSFTFTAPKAGIYTLTPATAYTGKDGSIYNATNRDATITVNVNGVDSSVAVATKTTGNLPELGEIHLNKGETITFTIAMAANTAAKEGSPTSVYMNFDVNLMEETPAFKAVSLGLADSLTVRFKIDKALFGEGKYTNPEVRYEIAGRTVVVTEADMEEEATRLTFPLKGIAPQEMNETITATLVATNAEGRRFVYQTYEYSVRTYCDGQINKATAAPGLKTLCVNTLNYGAAAQILAGYKTDDLVNAHLTEEQQALAKPVRADGDYTAVAQKTVNNTGNEATWKAVSLVLSDSIMIQVKFELANTEGCYVEFDDGTIVTADAWDYEEKTGRHIVRFSNIAVSNMQQEIVGVVKNADGEIISGEVHYSIESYAASNYNSTANEGKLAPLVKAMIAYGDAAADL